MIRTYVETGPHILLARWEVLAPFYINLNIRMHQPVQSGLHVFLRVFIPHNSDTQPGADLLQNRCSL